MNPNRPFKLSKVKHTMRVPLNWLRIALGCDNNRAIDYYKKLVENYKIAEQVDGYVREHQNQKTVLEVIKKEIFAEINPHLTPESCLLDYGVGTGRYLEMFRGQCRLIGIDANEAVLSKYTSKSVPEAELAALDFTQDKSCEFLSRHAGMIDVVYSVTVIQYLRRSRIMRFVSSIFNILKKGGFVVLQFPVPRRFTEIYSELGYYRYRPKELKNLLRKGGFEIVNEYSSVHHETFEDYSRRDKDLGYLVKARKPF